MRVHELAKELGLEKSKDILDALASLGIEGKSAQSNVDEKEEASLRNYFNKGAAAAEKSAAPKTDGDGNTAVKDGEGAGEKAAKPKKKKYISVFRPQNYSGKVPAPRKPKPKPRPKPQPKPVKPAQPVQPAQPEPPVAEVAPAVKTQPEEIKQPVPKAPVTPEEPKEKKRLTLDDIRRPDPKKMIRSKDVENIAKAIETPKKETAEPPKEKTKKSFRNEDKQSTKKPGAGASGDPRKGQQDNRRKDRDKKKEDKKFSSENDRNGFQGKNKKKFNHIPKALKENKPKKEAEPAKEVITEIKIPDKLTIRDLAERIKVNPAEIIKKLFLQGEMVTLNSEVDFDKASEIALDYNIIADMEEKEDVIAELLKEDEEDEKDLVPRPPVVCVMGHVDHGKTSILDAIRNTHVIDKEAGGITQHIGAYQVSVHGQKITFLDTPGHEAFTAMRMRGANSTDIAILVVAADDGVKPQTIEAINHAKAAGVEIIVAINKIDKQGANIDRVKQQLAEYELIPEDWGGTTVFCPVSAHTHEGIDDLLDMVLLTAEVMELKANPNRNVRGLVLEAKLDRGRGPVATILVQKGTLKQSDFIACGSASGKVRAMNDENGKRVTKATPSMPVEVVGLSDVPGAGEVLMSFDSDKEAKNFASAFVTEGKKSLLEGTQTQLSLSDLFLRIQEGSLKELPIIVKADVQGSVEAVSQSLLKLSNEEVIVKVIHSAVGNINESDVDLAIASNALIIGFNVKADSLARSTAEQNGIDINIYNVIYQIIDDISRALKGMKAAVYEEKVIGHAQIRQIFKSSGVGNIAGSYVTDGSFESDCLVRIYRGDEMIHQGKLASLKRFKDNVKEVKEGFECGLVFEDFEAFEVEDTIEAYKMVEVVE